MVLKQNTADEADDSSPPLMARLLSRAMRTGPLFQTGLWTQMPLLAMAKPNVKRLDRNQCTVELPFNWRTRNIFGTMYFAAILMAAEATTGGLVLFHNAARPEKFSYIVTGVDADFIDKARSTVTFVCREGDVVEDAFARAARVDERFERTLEVVGRREDGTEIARANVEWSWRGK